MLQDESYFKIQERDRFLFLNNFPLILNTYSAGLMIRDLALMLNLSPIHFHMTK